MSALVAIACALLAGVYVGFSGVRKLNEALPGEEDAEQLRQRLEAEAAAHLAWSRAAGELRAGEDRTEREEP